MAAEGPFGGPCAPSGSSCLTLDKTDLVYLFVLVWLFWKQDGHRRAQQPWKFDRDAHLGGELWKGKQLPGVLRFFLRLRLDNSPTQGC